MDPENLSKSISKTSIDEDTVILDEADTPMKKRRIHMDVQDCFAHAQTEDGLQPLSNPLESSNKQKPKTLAPRTPRVKQSRVHNTSTRASSFGGQLKAQHKEIAGGFESATRLCASSILPEFVDMQKESISTSLNDASGVCLPKEGCENKISTSSTATNCEVSIQNISTSCSVLNSQDANSRSISALMSKEISKSNFSPKNSPMNTPSKSRKQMLPSNQQKLTSFFTSSQKSETGNGKSGEDDKYVYGTTVSSYTPVKSVNGSSVIFVSDNESPDFRSSQKPSQENSSGYSSTKSSPTKCSLKDLKENTAVKKLFEGQRNLVANPNLKPKKASSVSNRFNSNKKSIYSKKEPKADQLMRMEADCISSSDDECMSQALDSVDKAVTNTYGLLGNGSFNKKKEEKLDYFSILPTEVMEHIFCHLPMLDLCLNSNRVCKRWNEIISSEKFMPWKKRYHKLKKNVEGTSDEMISILCTNNMRSPSVFLTEIISYMKDIKPVTSSNMTQCLETLPKYQWARELLEERAPHCIVNMVPNPWSMITCLVIIAESVQEIQKVLACLTSPSSDCTTQEVLECLYRLATFLHVFKKKWSKGPFSGMHYRLFYALYLYENASAAILGDLKEALSGKSGQQCMVKYGCADTSLRLTHEQMRVVNHDCHPGEIAKIVAFAGTGKTTTLLRYTQLRPQTKFLLVVFNKSVCDHAKTKFPRNVDCRTGHSLAFGKVGFRYKNAGKFRGNGPTVYSITQTIQNKKGDNLFIRAKFVLDTLNTFLSSADPVPTEHHVPDFRTDDAGNRVPIDPQKRKMYVDDTCYLWNRMKDLDDKNVPISHDGYLKLYQLSRPRLHWNYDCILIDEAQDLTPAISDILLSQNTSKILVGDPHQQIYSFRGAVNAMQIVQASTIFYLTQSFRFGPEIAEIAACCLELLKNEKKKTLVGNGQTCQVLGEKVGQLAVLTRCNFTLFNEAVKRCCHENTEDKVAFVGGTDGFGFGMIMDIYCLLLSPEQRKKERREIEHKLIKCFTDLPALEKYATKVQDNDLLGKIKIVRQHHHNLPGYIDKILKKTVRDTRVADVVLSTAHKSKGLEFSTVHLTDDFVTYIQMQELEQTFHGTPLRLPSEDESNLLYVAVTRAKNALIMSPTLAKLIQRAGCAFEYPVLSSVLKEKGVAFACMKTEAEFKPYALTLQKKDIKLSNGTTVTGGVYSPGTIKVENPMWGGLLGTTAEDRKKEEEYEEARRNR